MIHIINAKTIIGDKIENEAFVSIDGNKIVHIGTGFPLINDGDQIINAKGNYLSPGFIDLHNHGGGGKDFTDATVEAFTTAARVHAEHGTTALLPTCATCSDEELIALFEMYKKVKDMRHGGSRFLGLHLEGPYFSQRFKGAQDSNNIKLPKKEHYMNLLSKTDDIVRWSIAPELEGALELGRILREKGIIASVAHTEALYDTVEKAFENGYNLMTHFYNCMLGTTKIGIYRHAGAIEAAYLLDDMYVEIIADGHHLPIELLKLVYKIKGPDRIALISDALSAAGMPEGTYTLGSEKNGYPVVVEDGVAKLADRSSIAGSVSCSDTLVRTMVKKAGVPLVDAVKMASTTPAKLLKRDHEIGSIEVGKEADLVIFDEDINIIRTYIQGECVYESKQD